MSYWLIGLLVVLLTNNRQSWIAFDQWVNTRFGGYADETFSARCHRERNASPNWLRIRNLVNAIFFWQEDHCAKAFLSEQERKHLPAEYRT